MKKLITKALFTICLIGMTITLVSNIFLQVYSDVRDFKNLSSEYFYQIENVLKDYDKKLEQVKVEFVNSSIIRARAVAYIVQQSPEIIESRFKCETLAALLQVDELHFFDEKGVIYAGTHPEYYGLSVESGEQIGFFAPMLDDKTLELCQNMTPNTAEEKVMQYAAVWCKDGKKIAQIGMTPDRVMEAIEGNDMSDLFAMISCEEYSDFYAVDALTDEILGSTIKSYTGRKAADIGLNVSAVTEELESEYQTVDGEMQYCVMQRFGSRILVHTCPPCEIFAGIAVNMLFLCTYMFLMFLILLWGIYRFIERKIIRSIVQINEQLREIEQGNYHVLLTDNSTEEFAELCHSINAMTGSLLNFSGKISKALELSEVPIGIFEYEQERHIMTATSRVKDILMLTDAEYRHFMKNPELFKDLRDTLFCEDSALGVNIYRLKEHMEHYVRVEIFSYGKSIIAVLIDVTRDIEEKREIAIERDTDLLTGLYNRRAFFRNANAVFADSQIRKTTMILMIDLDHLKRVNDQYGHASGDRYILAFSNMMQACDVESKIAARMGGDEFCMLVYGFDSEDEASMVIDKCSCCRNQQNVVMENGEEIPLEYSMGWAFAPREGTELTQLSRLADERMYEDKRQRKFSK